MIRVSIPALISIAFGSSAMSAQCTPAVQKLINGRQFDAALGQLAALTSRSPADDKALDCTGRLYMERGDADKAIEWLDRAVAAKPADAQHHQQLGLALRTAATAGNMFTQMRLGPRMKSELERAIELDPASVDARLALVQLYAQAPSGMGGDTAKGREQAVAIVKYSPMRAHIANGLLAELTKNAPLAEKEFLAAIDARPDSEAAYASAGNFYRRAARYDEAIAMYEKQLKGAPADWSSVRRSNAHYNIGLAYQSSGRKDLAKSEFQLALTANPDNENAKKALASPGG